MYKIYISNSSLPFHHCERTDDTRWTEEHQNIIGVLDQSGIIQNRIRKYLSQRYLETRDIKDDVKRPFTLEQLFAIMIWLLSGLTFGILCFLIELTCGRCKGGLGSRGGAKGGSGSRGPVKGGSGSRGGAAADIVTI